MNRRGMKEFAAEKEISRETFDPTVTTVGEVVYNLWKQNDQMFAPRFG